MLSILDNKEEYRIGGKGLKQKLDLVCFLPSQIRLCSLDCRVVIKISP